MSTGTVLVIDDEELVRDVVEDTLRSEGITVSLAANGTEGIRLFRDHWREVGVVLLDLSMPGLSGEETYRLLREIDPSVKVIFSSGYSANDALSMLPEGDTTNFIKKPYKGTSLVEMICRIMRSSTTA